MMRTPAGRRALVLLTAAALAGCISGKDSDFQGDGKVQVHYDGGSSGKVPGDWKTVAAAAFKMGSPPSEPCREKGYKETLHQVTLTRSFQITATETTQAEFQAVRGYNPSYWTDAGATKPVEQLTWHEAAAYCNALSSVKGLAPCYACAGSGSSTACDTASAYDGPGKIYTCPGYRLPTEAEWEMAYRAGSQGALYQGALSVCNYDAAADAVAWYINTSSNPPGTRRTGLKAKNGLGLADMAGNVGEWVHDVLASDLGSASVLDPVTTLQSPGVISDRRGLRGGAWTSNASSVRAAFRMGQPDSFANHDIGFRCARSLP